MDPALRAVMESWLATGTAAQRRHARHRLALPDADSDAVAPPSPPAWYSRVCLWRTEGCGCAVPKCWAGLGERDGGKGCTVLHALKCRYSHLKE